jgi:hypothetical protein
VTRTPAAVNNGWTGMEIKHNSTTTVTRDQLFAKNGLQNSTSDQAAVTDVGRSNWLPQELVYNLFHLWRNGIYTE